MKHTLNICYLHNNLKQSAGEVDLGALVPGALQLGPRLRFGRAEDETISTLAEVGLSGPLQRPHLPWLPGRPLPVGALQAQSKAAPLLGAPGHAAGTAPAGVAILLPLLSRLPPSPGGVGALHGTAPPPGGVTEHPPLNAPAAGQQASALLLPAPALGAGGPLGRAELAGAPCAAPGQAPAVVAAVGAPGVALAPGPP